MYSTENYDSTAQGPLYGTAGYGSNCIKCSRIIIKHAQSLMQKIASQMPLPHSRGGGIVFNTMGYRSSEARSGYLQSSVSYIKVKMMFK